MNELRQLVRRFLSGEINYNQFRREFGGFFSRSDADPSLNGVCEMIESEFSAFEHDVINEIGLKLVLVQVAWGVVESRTVMNPVQIQINQPAQLVIPQNEARTVIASAPVFARVA